MLFNRYVVTFIAALIIIFAGVNMSLQNFNQDIGREAAVKAFSLQSNQPEGWQINLLGYEKEIKRKQLEEGLLQPVGDVYRNTSQLIVQKGSMILAAAQQWGQKRLDEGCRWVSNKLCDLKEK